MDMYLSFGSICDFLNASPESRCIVEGEQLVNCGHLIICQVAEKAADYVEVFSLCLQTSHLRSTPHEIKGRLEIKEETVKIQKMMCSCKAGLSSRCKHVAAVLIYCSRNAIGTLDMMSQTDKKCSWSAQKGPVLNRYTKNNNPIKSWDCVGKEPVKRIRFPKGYFFNTVLKVYPNSELAKHCAGRKPFEPSSSINNDNSDDNLDENCEKRCINNIFIAEESSFIKDLGDITIDNKCCQEFYNKVIATNSQTRICQESKDNVNVWKKERQFRITGSRCYALYTYAKGDWETKALKYFWPKSFTNKNVQYGIAYESKARDAFRDKNKCIIEETGLIISKEHPWLAYSPDGIIMEEGKPKQLLEIKCVIKGQEEGAENIIPFCKFLKIVDGKPELKKKHMYYGQVQLGMAILNVEQTSFIVYCGKDDTFVHIIVQRDGDFLNEFLKKLKTVYFNNLLHVACSNYKNYL